MGFNSGFKGLKNFLSLCQGYSFQLWFRGTCPWANIMCKDWSVELWKSCLRDGKFHVFPRFCKERYQYLRLPFASKAGSRISFHFPPHGFIFRWDRYTLGSAVIVAFVSHPMRHTMMQGLWNGTPCSPINTNRRFEGFYCSRLKVHEVQSLLLDCSTLNMRAVRA